jgi:hypothetical protein
MRTTVDLPDALFRRAKAHAAMQGQALKDLVADALELLLQSRRGTPPGAVRRTSFPLINSKDPNRKLSPEMVSSATEELLAEEAADHARFTGH